MVMELCEGGALLERIESGLYSEAYISKVVRSILRFIAQCHAKVRDTKQLGMTGLAAVSVSKCYISFLVRSILRFIAQCHAKVGGR